MNVLDLLSHNVPSDIFTLKKNCSLVEQAQNLIDQCHPGATNMKLLEVNAEVSEAEIPYAQKNRALHGFMHGGCLFSVGDTMTSIMAFFHIENERERTFTMDASIRYLRPVRTDTVRVKARLVSKEGKLLKYVCDFFNEENKRTAQAKYRYAIAEPR
ncbi:PaaI family thioesterase [Leptospira gomenensis]|uniref:PaaI family thioesterase n=1 Tax=Leptospira gomenensis TaxID=2484974 RepID=A0A5F1Z1B3_9LEPT|nr:PaaI family thioesterase [Leptospira gomenensis]TGK27925.1 PaaI family thioesterase [Leptospira gomenensis]TGK45469.1 PaaI family thioesterase [Leptospira gomenensis]TGK45856.1 PaaI family thioesterase [Leptospira gomenensis]TGK65218.1 PaaI family thioesterase [Leptospira gomenensis]